MNFRDAIDVLGTIAAAFGFVYLVAWAAGVFDAMVAVSVVAR